MPISFVKFLYTFICRFDLIFLLRQNKNIQTETMYVCNGGLPSKLFIFISLLSRRFYTCIYDLYIFLYSLKLLFCCVRRRYFLKQGKAFSVHCIGQCYFMQYVCCLYDNTQKVQRFNRNSVITTKFRTPYISRFIRHLSGLLLTTYNQGTGDN